MDFIRNNIEKNKKLQLIVRMLVCPIIYLLLGLSRIFPRNKNIYLFGSYSGSFAHNSKYLFLHISENYPNIKAVWISNNKNIIKHIRHKGFNAYHKYSFYGIYYSLIGKCYFYDFSLLDINIFAHSGAIKINLWHGVPIKKIEFDMQIPRFSNNFKNRLLYPEVYIKPDYILSTSKKVSVLFSSAFLMEKEQCLNFGYPRNEILSYSENRIMNFIEKYEPDKTKILVENIKKYDKVFVYMPTWRDNGQDFIQSASIDFEILNKILQERNYYLMLKLHHMTNLSVDIAQYKNILLLDNKLDIYPILPFTDCLITDYSSIFFDYKLMDKQVILFPFDKEEYISKNREMYYDYSLVTENQLVVNNFSELVVLMQSDIKNTKNNRLLQEMIFETKTKESSEEITKFVKQI
ncbi:MAG: CDP-glycerol glycerophosphotransferase family protein [Flavobacteriaceae bacterium]|nr:CDP-glycerol glycerophosphotransferase family protein [Flavobacteriaceae bacterium]